MSSDSASESRSGAGRFATSWTKPAEWLRKRTFFSCPGIAAALRQARTAARRRIRCMIRHVTALVILAALGQAQETRPSAFDPRGLEPIFDGRTLDGWVTKGGRYD